MGTEHSILLGFPERYTQYFPKYEGWNINPHKLKSTEKKKQKTAVLALEKSLL